MPTRLLAPPAIFLASFLLFLLEPMAARQLLPAFGGSAAVWMTCLVFFQTALLAGYLYAHLLVRARSTRWHLVLLIAAAATALTWAAHDLSPGDQSGNPAVAIVLRLAATIGLPFIALASTTPLLQVWYSRLTGRPMPYHFFAISNAASFLALLAYPTLIEPNLTLTLQRQLWASGVVLFALLLAAISCAPAPHSEAPLSASSEAPSSVPSEAPLSFRSKAEESASPTTSPQRLLWFFLPLAASMQLAAVTAHLTQNVAAIPLLWILPLAVYLLTFILAFEWPALRAFRGIVLRLLAVFLASLGYILAHTYVSLPIGIAIGFFLAELFFACLFCHAEAYNLRPRSSAQTTLFYLLIAAGGASGSFLVGIAFPLLFRGNYDIAIAFLVTAIMVLWAVWREGWPQRLLWATGTGLALFLVIAWFRTTLVAERNFYGSLRVTQTVTEHGDPMRTLLNGSIEHGTQIFSPDLRLVPSTYYATDSGIGYAMALCCAGRSRRVGVIGLGAGTLAAYGKPGDDFRFYEINPAVLPIAQNAFTWLRDSKAHLTFVPGDARTSLAAEPPQHFNILVIDAFSGDAIPLHLLTTQAFALYLRHLAPGGILAFHVSNQYVNLPPEIAQLASASHLEARIISSHEDQQSGEFNASWVLVATDPSFYTRTDDIAIRAVAIRPVAGVTPWTDDYTSLLPLIHW